MELLDNFNNARANVDETKQTQAQEAKKALDESKGKLMEVNQKLTEKQTEKTALDNGFANPTKAVQILEQLKGASIAQLRQLYNQAGVDFHYDAGYCAETAYYALIQAYGGKENLPEWLKAESDGGSFHYQSAYGWESAGRHNNKIVGIGQAQAGDVLVADAEHFAGNGNVADHVMMIKEVLPDGNILVIEGNGPTAGVAERVVGYSSDPDRYRIVSTHV